MAAVNKNFIVKNGLEVDESLIVANSNTNSVGIGTTISNYKLHVNGGIGVTDLYVSGIATIPNLKSTQFDVQTVNATTANIITGIVTTIRGTNLLYTGVSTVGYITATQIESPNLRITGVSTFTNGPILVGGGTSSGTASQRLQVIGGAYVSGSVGIGTTTPTGAFTVIGISNFYDIVNLSATNISGNLTFTGDNDIYLRDNGVINFGDGNDLQIFHNGSASVIREGGTGGLLIDSNNEIKLAKNGTGSDTLATFTPDGSVDLYFDNSKKFETTAYGVNVSGTLQSNQAYVTGVSTFIGNITGTISTATQLQNPRDFSINGDFVTAPAISFNGTGNVAFAATITPNSIGLGTYTSGDYVKNITGTANQITVTGGTGEGSTPVISIPTNPTLPGNVTVSGDLQVNNNLNVTGNITVGGTTGYLIVQDFKVSDADIVLGFATDAYGNDVSTDTTANHGGVAVASTEGTPLIQLYNVAIGETNPATYKKFMWFKSGSFAGLNTDSWISNYAIGIGSTQFPNGTRLAAGSVQFTEQDLSVVRNISATGVITASSITASSFRGSAQVGVATQGVYLGLTTQFNFVGSGITITPTYDAISGITTLTFTGGAGGGGGGGTPGGTNTQLQYNNSGVFGGISNFTFDGTNLNISSGTLAVTNSKINDSGIFATGIVTAINSAAQDSISLKGRNAGTSSFNLTLTPAALSASRTATFQDVDGTLYVSGGTDVTLADGGTNASLTASNGGIVYSTASAMAILSGTATAGQMLRSGASGAPSWSTATFPNTATATGTILRADGTNWAATSATYPTTTTANRILYSSATNTIGEITSANTAALVTNSTGVPSFASGTTANRVLRTDGSTVSFAQVSLTTDVTGTLPIANGGTNATATPTAGGVAYGTGSAYAFTTVGTAGSVLTSNAAGAPYWAAPSGGAGYQFNTGITSVVSAAIDGFGVAVLQLPSTAGREYIIHSINASNVAAGNTDVNVIGAFDFVNNNERSYFAYNIPVPTGTSIELLRQPQVLNPLDKIVMRGTDYDRIGSDTAVQVYISYETKVATNYFGVGVGTVGIASTGPVGVFTSTTYPSVLQSIRLANRTDTGDYPISVLVTSGVTTTYLVDDLIIPKYASVEILDTPKALKINDVVSVIVDQTETIDVQISGIQIV